MPCIVDQYFLQAVLTGEATDILATWLERGADLWLRDKAGNTVLHLAALSGHNTIVSWLLTQAPMLAMTFNQQGLTPLHVAAQHNQPETLNTLLTQFTADQLEVCLSQHDAHGRLPLYYAVYHDNRVMIDALLAHDANVNAIVDMSDDSTPLHIAALWGARQVLPVLVNYKASLTLCNKIGHTPLEVGLIQHPHWVLVCLNLYYPIDMTLADDIPAEWREQLQAAHTYYANGNIKTASLQFNKLREAAERLGYLPLQIHCVVQEALITLDQAYELANQAHQFAKTQHQRTQNIWRQAAQGYERVAKLFNGALAYLTYHAEELAQLEHNPLPLDYAECLLTSLQAVTSCLVQELFHSMLQILPRIREYRQALAVIPRFVAFNLAEPSQSVREVLAFNTGQVKALLKQMLLEAETTLGKPPCAYTAVGLGSMSREEISPCSDIEWCLLMDKDTSQTRTYFRQLAQLVNLSILNLGQTPILLQRYSHHNALRTVLTKNILSPTPQGLRLDEAYISPLGHPEVNSELMGEPEAFAQWVMEILLMLQEIPERVQIYHTLQVITVIHGESTLATRYRQAIAAYEKQ